jgi:2,4-dihydroxyhept-2-ene-1,7-dioic acid aldolase
MGIYHYRWKKQGIIMIKKSVERNYLKKQLMERRKVFAAWTSFGHPSISEVFSRSGVDFIGIDLEHSTISLEQAQQIIAVCHGSGTLALPRIASHNMEMIKRLLDSGADGIIAPLVSHSLEIENLISWCKYPPVGKRSYGVAPAQGYGFDFEGYTRSWNGSSTLIIQIESIQGVENVEELLNFVEVDGVMIGPYDISGSIGVPGQLDHPDVKEACKKVILACKRSGKSCGTHLVEPSLNIVQNAFSDGYTFVVLASDVFLLWKWGVNMKDLIEKIR